MILTNLHLLRNGDVMVSFDQKSCGDLKVRAGGEGGGDLEVRVVATEKEMDELEALLKAAE